MTDNPDILGLMRYIPADESSDSADYITQISVQIKRFLQSRLPLSKAVTTVEYKNTKSPDELRIFPVLIGALRYGLKRLLLNCGTNCGTVPFKGCLLNFQYCLLFRNRRN